MILSKKQRLLFLFVLFCTSTVGSAAVNLPDSLANWYKPENKRQVWLHTMFALRREMQAIEEYAIEGNINGVAKWTKKLSKHYASLPKMVPEWEDRVQLELINTLDKAVANKDFKQLAKVSNEIKKTCRSCHTKFRTLTALRYRVEDYSLHDFVENGKKIDFEDYKNNLSRTVNRIKISAVDGYWDKASASTLELRQKLKHYGESCAKCHKDDEPYERILGASTQTSLDNLLKGIEQKNVKKMGRSLGGLAVQVCARCHGVHRVLSEMRGTLFTD
ncbi:hypothetical protein H8E88_03930 [candidate division KSB1 bacterium]|nr:hypothetical protein [candidate division KSB1 bacterium]